MSKSIGQYDPVTTLSSGDVFLLERSGQYFKIDKDDLATEIGAASFASLSDTPASYAGSANYFVRVNATPDGLEFVQGSSINVSEFNNDAGYITSADGDGIYTGSGSLSGNTTVTQGANTLAFTASAVNAFSVDGTTFSVDASNDRIGIGTAAPSAQLHIIGSGGDLIRLERASNDYLHITNLGVWTSTSVVTGSTNARVFTNTVSPNIAVFENNSATSAQIRIKNTGSTGRAGINFDTDNTSAAGIFAYSGTHGTTFLRDKLQIQATAGSGSVATVLSGAVPIEFANTSDAPTVAHSIIDTNKNWGINTLSFGTSAVGVISHGIGTAPSTSPADVCQQYVIDHNGAGTATTHWRNEEGHIFKLVQSAAYTRTATVVEDRTLLASASATATNNNNVLAALIADLQTTGILG